MWKLLLEPVKVRRTDHGVQGAICQALVLTQYVDTARVRVTYSPLHRVPESDQQFECTMTLDRTRLRQHLADPQVSSLAIWCSLEFTNAAGEICCDVEYFNRCGLEVWIGN